MLQIPARDHCVTHFIRRAARAALSGCRSARASTKPVTDVSLPSPPMTTKSVPGLERALLYLHGGPPS